MCADPGAEPVGERLDTLAGFCGNGEDLKIYINPSDADKKEWLEERTGMTLTVSKENFVGGVRAVVKGRNVLIDHAYKGALEEEFQDFMFRGGTGIG